ncbi:hypothetical protein BN1182_AZ_01320 [Pantoea ananatis]|nr:hypothetical protein BN1182_AZ_01320 [Pantoea ananatis]
MLLPDVIKPNGRKIHRNGRKITRDEQGYHALLLNYCREKIARQA